MKRTHLIILLVVVVAGAILLFLPERIPVNVAVAQRGVIQTFVDERAKTRLPKVHRLTMPQAGRVLAIDLQEGTPTEKGQVVAQMSRPDLDTDVAQHDAQVRALAAEIAVNQYLALEKSALEGIGNVLLAMDQVIEAATKQTKSSLAKMEFSDGRFVRAEQLIQTKAISAEDYDERKYEQIDSRLDYDTDVFHLRALEAFTAAMRIWPREIHEWIGRKELQREVLRSQRAEAEALLAKAKRDRERGTLHSPVDGVVLRRFVSNERVLAAGEPLLEIGDLKQLEVETDVLTQDVVGVAVGNAVDIYGPAIGEKPVRAQVARIYPAGFTKLSSLGVEQQRVKVILHFEDGELDRLKQQGRSLGTDFRVRARIFTATNEDAVIVPRSGLFHGESGQWQLFVVHGNRALLKTVEVGLMNDDQVEIVSGVEADQHVVLAPSHTLEEGTRVDPRVLALSLVDAD